MGGRITPAVLPICCLIPSSPAQRKRRGIPRSRAMRQVTFAPAPHTCSHLDGYCDLHMPIRRTVDEGDILHHIRVGCNVDLPALFAAGRGLIGIRQMDVQDVNLSRAT